MKRGILFLAISLGLALPAAAAMAAPDGAASAVARTRLAMTFSMVTLTRRGRMGRRLHPCT